MFHLSAAFFVFGARQAAPAPPPPATAVSTLKDLFLFQGELSWFFWVALTGFCMCNVATMLGSTPKIKFAHGVPLAVLSCFGGSTLAAICCGAPIVIFVNEKLVPTCLAVYTVMYYLREPLVGFLRSPLGSLLASVTYEVMRCHVIIGSAGIATSSLKEGATVGPLVAGLLGGCGGAFMPLDKGLAPLANGSNWRFMSAALGSAWLHAAMHDPRTKPTIVGAFPVFADASYVRFALISFCVAMPLVARFTGFAPFGANPLVPDAKVKRS